MKAINPATGEPIAEYPDHSPADVERRLAAATGAFSDWREAPFAARAALLVSAAAVLRRRRDELARLMTLEMGKPIVQAEAEIEKCAWACDHFAARGESYLTPEIIESDASWSAVRFDPLGLVLAVMPWNFPFWQVFRAAAPALMAGNVMALKHSSNVPGCALAIEEVFAQAGFPAGVFATLLISAETGEALVDHTAVQAVSLTGSEPAGVALAGRAGRALKKVVLELGGSDPFIVLADAPPEETAAHAAAARTINNGQSCIAAKRFLVEEPAAERFETALAERMKELVVGDPLDRATQIGPLARADLVSALEAQVRESVKQGARVLAGGVRREGPGFYHAPTVLADVTPEMPVFAEETFGPVAAVVRARDAAHAVALANQTRYGLGASLWTRDSERGRMLAAQVEAGSVFVNGVVKSDPRLPFGGIKRSGYGRELGVFGAREFVNVKTVWVR